jgi:hypothetical protein
MKCQLGLWPEPILKEIFSACAEVLAPIKATEMNADATSPWYFFSMIPSGCRSSKVDAMVSRSIHSVKHECSKDGAVRFAY